MLCENCQELDAKVHVSKIVNGKKEEIYLCEECAQINNNLDLGLDFSFNNLLTGLLNNQFHPHKINFTDKQISCDFCGLSYDKFTKRGRLGCNKCYSSFEEKIDKVLQRIHGTNEHTGKIPKRSGEKVKIIRQIEKLKKQIDQAVEKEEFEKAAEIRDEIKRLKGKIGE
ncbi:UvrB/UvrC motif-containing protein [Orenia marismortui]|uniref:Protein arginine kinase activator n=1 Tax=Orenia marismortui TaxID=46469 RepID=A0A4R8GTF8_9FIRM|nr:UvrB/UvrC motif-containing protein [Orenia marismortui]TDX49319.1 protein arginine kinase activator [Orenia marismortui]